MATSLISQDVAPTDNAHVCQKLMADMAQLADMAAIVAGALWVAASKLLSFGRAMKNGTRIVAD
jgi:hypothetical protein